MVATYVLYFAYMALLSAGLSALTGCIGFYSCLWFTRKIYASIKVRVCVLLVAAAGVRFISHPMRSLEL